MKRTFILLFLIASAQAWAQQRELKHVVKYAQAQGLSSYNVRKVIRDKKGFLWVGTQDGLNKFDGRNIVKYYRGAEAKHSLAGIDVREIIEDTVRNLIWVLPGEVGLTAINVNTGNVVKTIPIKKESPEDWHLSMLLDGNYLWIGLSTGIRIYNLLENRFETLPRLQRSPSNAYEFEVRSLFKDEYGAVWVCYSGYGIVIYDGSTKKVIKEMPLKEFNDHQGKGDIKFYNCAALTPGTCIIATSQGLRKVSFDKTYTVKIDNYPVKKLQLLNTQSVTYVCVSRAKSVYVSVHEAMYRLDSTLDSYTLLEESPRMAETDWLNSVQCIYEDEQEDLWLGCQEGLGFISKLESPFLSYNYDKYANTKLDHVRSLYRLPNGDIMAGLRNGLVYIDHRTNKYEKLDSIHLCHHIFSDARGRIHVSRDDGMYIYQGGKLIPAGKIYKELAEYASIPANSHLFLGDSLVILGTETDNGILLWYPRKREVRQVTLGNSERSLASSIVNNIYQDHRKNIWVLSDNVITILGPDLVRKRTLTLADPATKQPYGLFFDMCHVKDSYWIASYGAGLVRLDSFYSVKELVNTKQDLSNNGVYQLFNLADTALLITSNDGLSLFNIHTRKVSKFYLQDGLHSNGFEEVAGFSEGGYVYAGGIHGFTRINPRNFSINTTPPELYISSIEVEIKVDENKVKHEDTSDLSLKDYVIHRNAVQTKISFSAINYKNPGRTTYSYKIKELDNDWIDRGTDNFINLTPLPPRKYTVFVRAFNEDGVKSEITFTLKFQPKWYQTKLFKIAIGLVAILLFYAIYRYRMSQIRREEATRRRIAGDLHDDIGGTLNGIKVFANLALQQKDNSQHLLRIKQGAQDAISGLRDIIWVLDDQQDTIEQLSARIVQFAIPLCDANNITFKRDVDPDLYGVKLDKEEKRNIYMALKESINNSIKYSGCSRIALVIERKLNQVWFIAKDDGKGFDSSLKSSGNGLRNIQYRAKQVKYKAMILSSLGNGTEVALIKSIKFGLPHS